MTSPRTTGVWISADSAMVLRLGPEPTEPRHIDSTVPGRHRSTGHAPTEKHPGAEGHRDEHMRTFFADVAEAVPAEDDLLLVGDGEVVDHFADQVRTDDESHHRTRRVEVEKAGAVTERQLLARLRAFTGVPAKRHLPR